MQRKKKEDFFIHLIRDKDPIVMVYDHPDCKRGKVHLIPFVHADYPRMASEFNWRVFMLLKNSSDTFPLTDVKRWTAACIKGLQASVVKTKEKEEEEKKSPIILPGDFKKE